MPVATKPLLAMTAGDLMTIDVILLSEDLPLRKAARRLAALGVTGAPVVDAAGKCVGVLSSTDYMRLIASRDSHKSADENSRPTSCSFQKPHAGSKAARHVECALPYGSCSVQGHAASGDAVLCHDPHCVFADWQVVEMEELPSDEIRNYMTADPVTAVAEESIQVLARRMIDARVHRVIVVDELQRPIGVVSSTDIVAAVSCADPGRD